MTSFSYKNELFKLVDGESILDCLLRHGVDAQYACKNGVCHTCLMETSDEKVPENSQKNLPAIYKNRGFFLPCQCHPKSHIKIKDIDTQNFGMPAELLKKKLIGKNILQVLLKPYDRFRCKPGQYITLINLDGTKRSYSIANNPQKTGIIELHVQLIENGAMSSWLNTGVKVGDEMMVCGPFGECFYHEDSGKDYLIILIGTGTGLAPLYGVLNDALEQGHQGKIELYHSAKTARGLYLEKEIKMLEDKHKNFTYYPCVLNAGKNSQFITGDIRAIIKIPEKSDLRLYICGAPKIVEFLKLKAQKFKVGERRIYTDPFLSGVVR